MPPEVALRQIRSLTSIRGILACYVAFYHISEHTVGLGMAKTFVEHGYIAVDFFFALSGYVMAMKYHGGFSGSFDRGVYFRFLWQRIARVAPLYIASTLLFSIVATTGRHAWLPFPRLPAVLAENLAMVQSWGIERSLNPAAWSISTEWAAYLLFPAFVWAGLRSRWRAIACVAVCYAGLALIVLLPADGLGLERPGGSLDISDGRTIWPLARCFALFAAGVVSWRLAQFPPVKRLADLDWPSAVLASVAIGLLFVPMSDLALAVVCPLVIVSISTDRPFVARALGIRPLFWLGEVSYSIYLVHMLMMSIRSRVIDAAAARMPFADAIVTSVLCCMAVAVAAVTYYAIEKPGRELLGRWSGPLASRHRLVPASISTPQANPS